MLSNVRNLFEKLTEPDEDSSNSISRKSKSESINTKKVVEEEDLEGWERVNEKRSKPKKEEVDDPVTTFVLSELIKNDVCIHCMAGKCREGSKSHSSVYFPDGFTSYIKNPLMIQELDDILKKNPLNEEKFNGYSISYSICMRNHCRNRCKLNHGKIQFTDEKGIKGEIYYCYPDMNMIHRKKIVLGLHMDVNYIDFSGKKAEIFWKPIHNKMGEDEEPVLEIVKPEEKSVVKATLNTWAKLAAKTKEEVEEDLKIQIPTPSEKKTDGESLDTSSMFSSPSRRPYSTPFKGGNPVFTELLNIVKSQQEKLEEESKKTDLLMEMNQKLIRLNESYQDQLYVLRSDMKLMKDSLQKMNEIHKMVSKSVDSREKYKLFTEFLKDSNNSITEQIVMTQYDRYVLFS